MKSGFGLAHRSSKSLKQLDKGYQKLSAYLSLHCQHGLTYHGKEKSFELVSKTKWSRNVALNANSESIFLFINIPIVGVFTIIRRPRYIPITIILVILKWTPPTFTPILVYYRKMRSFLLNNVVN